MRADGDGGESSGSGAGERPFDDRTRASLMVLGEGLALLNSRLGVAEGVARATADANLAAFRDLTERVSQLEDAVSDLIRALSTGSAARN